MDAAPRGHLDRGGGGRVEQPCRLALREPQLRLPPPAHPGSRAEQKAFAWRPLSRCFDADLRNPKTVKMCRTHDGSRSIVLSIDLDLDLDLELDHSVKLWYKIATGSAAAHEGPRYPSSNLLYRSIMMWV
jgi:hypothetical protein